MWKLDSLQIVLDKACKKVILSDDGTGSTR